MLAHATAAAHGGSNYPTILIIIAAVALAAFWKTIVKIGIALLGIVILVAIVGGASAIVSILHH